MPRIVISNKFKRALKKFTRNNNKLQSKIEKTISLMATDLGAALFSIQGVKLLIKFLDSQI